MPDVIAGAGYTGYVNRFRAAQEVGTYTLDLLSRLDPRHTMLSRLLVPNDEASAAALAAALEAGNAAEALNHGYMPMEPGIDWAGMEFTEHLAHGAARSSLIATRLQAGLEIVDRLLNQIARGTKIPIIATCIAQSMPLGDVVGGCICPP